MDNNKKVNDKNNRNVKKKKNKLIFNYRHQNDQSLDGPFAVHCFYVEGIKDSFSYFRILQTGHNSNNRNYLAASNFEIFGTLYDKTKES